MKDISAALAGSSRWVLDSLPLGYVFALSLLASAAVALAACCPQNWRRLIGRSTRRPTLEILMKDECQIDFKVPNQAVGGSAPPPYANIDDNEKEGSRPDSGHEVPRGRPTGSETSYKSEPYFDTVEHSFGSFPAEDMPTPTQRSISAILEGAAASPHAGPFRGSGIEDMALEDELALPEQLIRQAPSPLPPVDQNGRRKNKSVVPGQLDVAFFRKRARTIEREEQATLSKTWEAK